ncbi:MAG: hypothetical protein JJU36_00295 [Phycisphaeraceae bacterium]|nr:hypothetical protein [Phycisphaeraceae bacterium]
MTRSTLTTTATWHREVFFGIHYDLHASAEDAGFGAELTAEHLRARLEAIRPDWIQCDCKGHKGYCGYPTRIGSAAPGLVGDPLAIHRQVTRDLGIRLGVHYSGVWDARAIELNPDWARIDESGNADLRITCRHSEYLDELMIPQLLEIIDQYDVDGFWVDGDNWASKPCWCVRCLTAFGEQSGQEAPRRPDHPYWHEWLAFHRELFVDYLNRWIDAVHDRKPDCVAISSYAFGARQPDRLIEAPIDCMSGDMDFRWGAEHAMLESRVFNARGLPWNLMAWMHTKPGEMRDPRPWVVKPLIHLCQELSEAIAQGGAAMVYEQPQRSGWLTGWHHERIAALADFLRKRKPFCRDTQTASEVAILHTADHFYRNNIPLYEYEPATEPIEGTLHGTIEHQLSVDILTEDAFERNANGYRLLIVPEQTNLDARIRDQIEAFAQRGGHVLMTGAHLAVQTPDLVGADPAGEPIERGNILPIQGACARLFGTWQPVKPRDGGEPLIHRLSDQEPEKDRTDDVLVTRRIIGQGSIIAAHGPLFGYYFNSRFTDLRRLIHELIDHAGIDWRIQADGASRLEIVARTRGEQLLIHLINRGPGIVLPPKRILIDELPPLMDIQLKIALPEPPAAITLEPSGQTIATQHESGTLHVTIPKLEIHETLVIQTAAKSGE